MEELISQIKKALDNNLYYLALLAALTLPDICGALSSEDGKATKQRYIEWFNKYVGEKYKGCLTGEDCYYFRCSFVHQGTSQHPKSNYSRVIFVEPTGTSNIFHCNILEDALNIDVRIFVMDILEGVEKWLREVKDTEVFKKNYARFMKRYPNGLPPYIVGVPVIS
ncbi:hypothetical protein NF865_06920 [Thermococcus aggregans]|uniref:Uncharacterized protein n=1 Tax=Thermococcus aggregans TaxID=110163 RepID=A0A9E7MWF7_THEAG|nr:hypothetical protein [Thermococcus aggregans]USS40070.1 hypothetical protein NF865_06920 [Thermococcus aggregans]